MPRPPSHPWWLLPLVVSAVTLTGPVGAQQGDPDARVRRFLEEHAATWHDMNVPPADGQRLYDLVLEHGFTRVLEVGTSTGHSAVWIAWALRSTGGRLITLEIDPGRHRAAMAHFEEAGLSDLIDARIADAHEAVPALAGPFDFVFLDADKDWNPRYFAALLPKLAPGGCIATHNVSGRRTGWVGAYLDLAESTPGLTTEIVGSRWSGMAVSCRVPS